MLTALYPGRFDPVTNGHLDLIRRAVEIFEKVIVGVAVNPGKGTLFSVEERVQMLEQATQKLPSVTVKSFGSLVVQFAKEQKAQVIKLSPLPSRHLPELSGIMFSPDNKHAAIVGKTIVHVGEMVDDYLVKKIEKSFVILKRGEKEYKLYVAP